jgi:hypothetical protein
MDLDTFLTTLYVVVDDWYKAEIGKREHVGARERMGDSEVLTVALAGQWRIGVPWRSERGVVRWMHHHGRGWFPRMLGRSEFNQRMRSLWVLFIRLQQRVAEWLSQPTDIYECVDTVPLVAMSNGQAKREPGHWLWESQRGHGGTSSGFFVGDHCLMSVTARGVITGWLVGNADINDRWLLSAFLSARAGRPELVAPPVTTHASRAERATPPVGHIGAFQAVGWTLTGRYWADQGFNSRRWRLHWANRYAALVWSVPPANDPERAAWSRQACLCLAAHRQIVDTVFARLSQVFDFEHLNAHSRWGQYTRIAAKIAAYHLGLWLNQSLGRPLGALATLLT